MSDYAAGADVASATLLPEEVSQLKTWLSSVRDEELHEIMTNLGGHCFETLVEAFGGTADKRTVFICYTIKGNGLPLNGHRDNHGKLLLLAVTYPQRHYYTQ